MTRTRAATACLFAAGLGVVVGHWLTPTRTQSVLVDREVYLRGETRAVSWQTSAVAKNYRQVVTRWVPGPAGVTVERVEVEKQQKQEEAHGDERKENVAVADTSRTVVRVAGKPDPGRWRLAAGLGWSPATAARAYHASLGYRLLGPLDVGVWGAVRGQERLVGLELGVRF